MTEEKLLFRVGGGGESGQWLEFTRDHFENQKQRVDRVCDETGVQAGNLALFQIPWTVYRESLRKDTTATKREDWSDSVSRYVLYTPLLTFAETAIALDENLMIAIMLLVLMWHVCDNSQQEVMKAVQKIKYSSDRKVGVWSMKVSANKRAREQEIIHAFLQQCLTILEGSSVSELLKQFETVLGKINVEKQCERIRHILKRDGHAKTHNNKSRSNSSSSLDSGESMENDEEEPMEDVSDHIGKDSTVFHVGFQFSSCLELTKAIIRNRAEQIGVVLDDFSTFPMGQIGTDDGSPTLRSLLPVFGCLMTETKVCSKEIKELLMIQAYVNKLDLTICEGSDCRSRSASATSLDPSSSSSPVKDATIVKRPLSHPCTRRPFTNLVNSQMRKAVRKLLPYTPESRPEQQRQEDRVSNPLEKP